MTIVLLKVCKDVKLTMLGGRLFQVTATCSLKKFLTHVEPALIYDNFIRITVYTGIFRAFSGLNFIYRACTWWAGHWIISMQAVFFWFSAEQL